MSSHHGVDGRHKKILRTRVKVWGKFLLKSEMFDVNKAEQLIHQALDSKMSVQSSVKMYGDGMRIGEKGVLAALHAEFVPYTNITAFISLREATNILALCNKEAGSTLCVTILQFKDMDALQVVCDIIDRQRGVAAKSIPSSLSQTEVAGAPKLPSLAVIPAAQNVVVATSKPPAPAKPVPPAEPPVSVATSAEVRVEQPSPPPLTSLPQPQPEPPQEVMVVANTNIFEKRPFSGEVTQPPVTARFIVHPSTSAAAHTDEDDEDHFRTSIVFGEEVIHTPSNETQERQRRMEYVLQMRADGYAEPTKSNTGCIEAVILNYDEIDTEGTHAVFDTPDGPPIQLNESTQNLRRRPNELLVTPTTFTASPNSGNSRLVVTSFSSGRSNSPTEPRDTYMRAAASADIETSYKTSAVIYRDAPLLDSPTEQPRVTYVTNQRSSATFNASAPQPLQLVRLVPVASAGSARQRVFQQQPQYFTIQPVSPMENGVHLVAKRP